MKYTFRFFDKVLQCVNGKPMSDCGRFFRKTGKSDTCRPLSDVKNMAEL